MQCGLIACKKLNTTDINYFKNHFYVSLVKYSQSFLTTNSKNIINLQKSFVNFIKLNLCI